MDAGMMMIFPGYGWEDGSDGLMWNEELRLAEIAADAGFDCLWSAERHFNDYSFVPDNLQPMTYVAAKYPNNDVGTATVLHPWHDPVAGGGKHCRPRLVVQRPAPAGVRARSGAEQFRTLRWSCTRQGWMSLWTGRPVGQRCPICHRLTSCLY